MAITSYQQAPYFDDFNSAGVEAKNYLKVLFRPGYSVQVRELNQLQSIIQSQIDKFGQSIYVDGTPVTGGKATFDKSIQSFDVDITETSNPFLFDNITRLTRVQNAAGIIADVLKVVRISSAEEVHKFRLYIRYASSVQTGVDPVNVRTFVATDVITNSITVEDDNENVVIGTGSYIGDVEATGFASLVMVPKGVFFIKGCFVVTEEQKLFIDLATENELITGHAVFRVTESVKTYTDDITLLDNANGAPNYNAQGANRYTISLGLEFLTDAELAAAEDDFIKLLRIGNSSNVTPARTEYSNLDRLLAQRTAEESGNYTVRPFGIDIREMYNDEAGNRGKYTEDQLDDLEITVDEAKENYVVGIEPSVAYVEGYRIELINRKDLIVPKARDTAYSSGVYQSARLGNYLEGEIVLDGSTDVLADITRADFSYTIKNTALDETIGTCQVRGLEYVSGDTYRLYIFNLQLAVGKTLIEGTKLRGNSFSFDSIDLAGFELFESGLNKSLFKLPNDTVQSLYAEGGSTPSIRYKVRKSYTGVSGTSGLSQVGATYTWVVASGTNYKFVDDTPSAYIVMASDFGVIVPTGVVIGAGGTTATLTFTGPDPIGAATLTLHASVEALDIDAKAKTLTTHNETKAYAATITLAKGDCYKITSIKVSGGPDVDIQDEFLFDSGQRDFAYVNGTLKYIGSTDRSAQSFVIIYTYFSHSGSGDYFSVDSYNTTALGGYDKIPSYGGTRLSDVVDFRPVLLSGGGAMNVKPIDPNSVVVAGLTYYIPRIDRVVVTDSGEFKVVEGISALNAVSPPQPANSMTLYTLEVPAYTFKASDIQVKYIDNRRYTMRDIGDINQRVTNLEYYTSLSLLEKEASGKQILDDSGGDRYKNGILVDSFLGHSVGDAANRGYKCAIDPQAGILRPSFSTESIRFTKDTVDAAIRVNGNTVTLDFDEEVLAEQLSASTTESVNPYDIATWDGQVTLSPASDEWKSTSVAPDLVVNERGIYDAVADLAERSGVLGTQWNEWETAWTGSTRTRRRSGGRTKITTTTTTELIREGLRTTLSYTDVEQNIGDRVVDVSYIPFIRSRVVYFSSSMLRPGTRVYPFFDGVDVSAYARPDAFVAFKDSEEVTVYEGVLPGGLPFSAEPLITDATGKVSGRFIVPNNSSLRFRTGDREFKLTDSPRNDNQEMTTGASTTYRASGLLETKQATIISTRTPQLTTTTLSESRTDIKTQIRWKEPLAQTFIIGDISSGAYLTSIDCFFSAKSTKNLPVILEVVTVENGIPTQNVLPFSVSVVDADDVLVSEDSSLATKFAFSDPVYLQAGVEYAFVLRSNDADYRTWVSELGGQDVLTGQLINKNSYAGVMFTSQNASTWTPHQNRDLKFRINRAEFTTTPGTITLEKLIDEDILPVSFSTFNLTSEELVLADTSIEYSLDLLGTDYAISPSHNYSLDSEVEIDSLGDALILTAILSTDNAFISPVIDLDRISILTVKNIVNDLNTDEDTSDAGSSSARYLTKRVDLNDPAEFINIFALINRPSDATNVDVYVKLRRDDSTPYEDLEWNLLPPMSPVPVASDGKFTEIQYSLSSDGSPFSSFSAKIVMRSSNSAFVPAVKDFRLIATT